MPDPRQAVETLEQLTAREPAWNSPARGGGGS